jgi:predicted transcriptional regulator
MKIENVLKLISTNEEEYRVAENIYSFLKKRKRANTMQLLKHANCGVLTFYSVLRRMRGVKLVRTKKRGRVWYYELTEENCKAYLNELLKGTKN